MRSGFDKQLTELNREMISMGSLCENAIAMSAKALLDGDTELARKVPELSAQIERKERDIESMCLKLLLQQLFAVAAQEPVVRAGVRPGDFVQHSEQFFVPDGKPAVVMRRQFQIFNSLAFCSCWGRGGAFFCHSPRP